MLDVGIKKQLAHYEMDISFSMDQEILVLFGPSGSGKTTILNSLAGLTQPDSGLISLNGTVFFDEKRSLSTQARNIGYLFQDYALFPHMTVKKNILYGAKRKGQTDGKFVIEQLLKVLRIEHLLPKYPHQISGGEKQRVALARALATEPSMLLLDEPLSALDKDTRIQCQDELLRLHAMWEIPFIIVTHDIDEAKRLGHRILFLERGTIARVEEKKHEVNEVVYS